MFANYLLAIIFIVILFLCSLFLFSLVCTALRGKTKAFNEMEANFKVRNQTAHHSVSTTVTCDGNEKRNFKLILSTLYVNTCICRICPEALLTLLQS